jgi:hypothetical protein
MDYKMLTSRITIENDQITAWIDKDGVAWIEQPFFPSGNGPEEWSSEEAAQSWADNWIEEYNNRPEPTPL